MITVYGRATSSNVQAVMWGIGELGLVHCKPKEVSVDIGPSVGES